MHAQWLPVVLVSLLARTVWATIPPPVHSSTRISTLTEEQEGPRSTTAEVVAPSASAGDASSMSSLSLSLVTWNFAEQCPRSEDAAFLKGFRNGSDIVVLGVQECEDIKPRRHEGHRSRAWRHLQKKTFGKGYKCVAQHRMGGLQIAVYGNKNACKLIQGMQILDVACGVGNVLTNKGGICVLLRIKGQTLALINGHFAAHQTKVSERNADFHRILSSITARAQPRWLVKALAQKRKSVKRRGQADPWLEQMFQAVGLPEDKIHAQRQAAASSRDLPKRREKADSGSRPLQAKKSKIKNKGKSKSKSESKSKSKSKAREEVTLQSLIPDEVLGFKVKFPSPAAGGGGDGAKRSPIIPSIKKKKEEDVVEETASDDSDAELPRRGVEKENVRVFSSHDRLQSSFNSRGSSASTASSSVQTRMLLPESRNVLPSLEDVPFDAIVFLGDFNYRVDLPRLEMEYLAEKATREASVDVAQLQRLLEFDQLGRERRLGKVFRGFSEGDIRFLPTFKYDKGSAKFDSSAKARCPAWTDRILYAVAASNNGQERGMQLLLSDYYSIDSRHSDHRPVAAEFLLTL